MKMRFSIFAASLLAVGSAAAFDITAPFSPSLWVASDHDTQAAVGPPVGSSSVPQPPWAVVQWFMAPNGVQPPLPASSRFKYDYVNGTGWNNYVDSSFQGNNAKWTLANSAASVTYNAVDEPWLNGTYTLAQNGLTLTEMPCGGEYDLFIQPKGPLLNLGPLASGAPDGFAPVGPLSSLSSLVLHAGLKVAGESINNRCVDGPNKVGYGVAIFLRNTANGTTFFYQLTMRNTAPGTQRSDGIYLGFQDQFGNSGVDDFILNLNPSYGVPVPGGARVAYSGVNILSRLNDVISRGWALRGAGPEIINFDSNTANWRVDGMFFGQYLWGGVYAASQWDNVRLQADYK